VVWLGNAWQCAPMVGIAQRMVTPCRAKGRPPMVLHGGPTACPQHPGRLHRLVAALGMHRLMRPCVGRGHRPPRQLPLYAHPRRIDRQARRSAPWLLHRCGGWGTPWVPVLRSLPDSRCAHAVRPHVITYLRRPLPGTRVIMGAGRCPSRPWRALWDRVCHGGRQGAEARSAPGGTDCALGAMRRDCNAESRHIAPLALCITSHFATHPGCLTRRTLRPPCRSRRSGSSEALKGGPPDRAGRHGASPRLP
jgi:hypothetical protein